jgi:hypothetical protein
MGCYESSVSVAERSSIFALSVELPYPARRMRVARILMGIGVQMRYFEDCCLELRVQWRRAVLGRSSRQGPGSVLAL